eukprot:scaffold42267_cov66-Phaeocystis_antarctica.AAC.2
MAPERPPLGARRKKVNLADILMEKVHIVRDGCERVCEQRQRKELDAVPFPRCQAVEPEHHHGQEEARPDACNCACADRVGLSDTQSLLEARVVNS